MLMFFKNSDLIYEVAKSGAGLYGRGGWNSVIVFKIIGGLMNDYIVYQIGVWIIIFRRFYMSMWHAAATKGEWCPWGLKVKGEDDNQDDVGFT
jgi:hypothetical protein